MSWFKPTKAELEIKLAGYEARYKECVRLMDAAAAFPWRLMNESRDLAQAIAELKERVKQK